MADLFTTMRLVIYDALFAGRASASTDPEVVAKRIPTGRFMPTQRSVALDDEALNLSDLDRRCWFRWDRNGRAGPHDAKSTRQERITRFTLTHAVLEGEGADDQLLLLSGESAATALEFPRDRILSDNEVLSQALECQPLIQGAGTDDPRILYICGDGDGVIIPTPAGVVQCERSFLLRYRYDSGVAHSP
jgi:hypothetical protein